MKGLILSLSLLFALCCDAQIVTKSSCDSNTDGEVTVADVTNTANKVLGKVAAEKQVVTAEDLNSVLSDINTKLASNTEELRILKECLSSIAEKVGAKTPEEIIEDEKYTGHEYVDLGLSAKWATCNVGAVNPEDLGLYFAWGETTGYTSDISDGHSFDWTSLKYCLGTTYEGPFSKYVISSSYGTIDNKTVLESTDDAATVSWGDSWRIPTATELQELIDNCYWEWTSNYNSTGVTGYIVYKVKSNSDKGVQKTSGSTKTTVGSYTTNDTHIFLPAAGKRSSNGIYDVRSSAGYWSNTLNTGATVYYISFNSSNVGRYSSYRSYGLSVRAICQ